MSTAIIHLAPRTCRYCKMVFVKGIPGARVCLDTNCQLKKERSKVGDLSNDGSKHWADESEWV